MRSLRMTAIGLCALTGVLFTETGASARTLAPPDLIDVSSGDQSFAASDAAATCGYWHHGWRRHHGWHRHYGWRRHHGWHPGFYPYRHRVWHRSFYGWPRPIGFYPVYGWHRGYGWHHRHYWHRGWHRW